MSYSFNLSQYCVCTWQMWHDLLFTNGESEILSSFWLPAFFKTVISRLTDGLMLFHKWWYECVPTTWSNR